VAKKGEYSQTSALVFAAEALRTRLFALVIICGHAHHLLPQWVEGLPGQTHASLEVRDAQRSAPPGGLVLLSDPLCVYEFILSLQAFHQTK
jgi:hypothetical protein